ncbi:uncharacterized protein K460DRAFT_370718 [Cucurbitaria berberidis CBS 394.84]|uniref:Rhodopsin domain-containing protein n=1 Tax=Cucurbitaria berberidis CBS 394.84 TaxID=1168544 RepID=A0A9P4L3Y2_9PLEO|nr:uncharacterized protein K460DRAFT_370718 [Cucurbitaria berberidis CBS 394.84]KAF1840757.1 hypothetical protein K460DRAFT_370718 [Cucurbitaria berberidis CBS 394.84]
MVSIWYIIILFMTIFLCTPIAANWDLTVTGKCLDRWDLNRAAPVPWVVTDFVVLLAPLPWLKRLNIRYAEKVALIGLFLLGSFTCIVSAIRYGQIFLIKEDATWDIYNLGILSTIEASVTVLCTSLIASKPAIVAVVPKAWQKRFNDYLATHSRSANSWTPRIFHGLPQHAVDSGTLVKANSGSVGKTSGERTLASKPSRLEFVTSVEMTDVSRTAEKAV